MVKVQSITHPDTIISVDENHYYSVLARSKTWQLYDEPEKIKEKAKVIETIVEELNTTPVKRLPGRPKTKGV